MPLERLDSLNDLRPEEWDGLLRELNPFVRHAFLVSLEDSGSVTPEKGWTPCHWLWRDESGGLAAALPGYGKTHSYGEYVFDHGWADACQRAGIAYYPKWLGAVPFSPVSGPRVLGDTRQGAALLEALEARLGAEGHSGAHVNFTLADDDTLFASRNGWLERIGCQFHWRNRGYRDFDDFLEVLTSRKRKQMRKERNNVAAQGIEFEWLDGAAVSESHWDFVYACYATTYAVRGQRPYLTRAFFSLLAERMPDALRVVIARQGSQPVAMALFLHGGTRLYGRYWGCLAEYDHLHFETCFYQGIESAIAFGMEIFDAGAQGEHKLIRGFEPVITRSWHLLRHPGLREAVADFLVQERAGVLAYLGEATQALPYRQPSS